MKGLAGQVVLITGAAGALGRAVAEAFANVGARRVLLDIDRARLRDLYGAGDAATKIAAVDLRDSAAIDAAVAAVLADWGRVDALCNIAGGFDMGPPVHETTDEAWQHMLDLNAGSVLRMARAVVPAMLAAGGGKVINIGAMGGVAGRANMAAYGAAKSAVIRLTESMSGELREAGINVNCVLPSIIDTPANRAAMPDADAGRWVSPDALADVIVFLASDGARAVHGAALPVVGLS